MTTPAVTDAHEWALLEALVRELKRIGKEGGSAKWRTAPAVVEEWTPGAEMNEVDALYVEFDITEEHVTGTSGVHVYAATYLVWVTSADPERPVKRMLNLLADARDAIHQSEGRLTTAGATHGVWTGSFEYDAERSRSGLCLGRLTVRAEFEPPPHS